ncbi:NrtR DNA-binding winged helix domain-containing protein [Dyadobacter sp. Leaf189]|uniref:NUDIX hydrolase n=1 Tax=Dyadobacter sp. Leaf189 TaxID=1736295 RepID=UPI0006F57DA9|nr:NUDIX domain-containing protein [Dyadobacter sp. Leaf189]KQS26614.1 NUDIX hydrolase [Dyadobacter sp. Leaf189]
MSQNLHYPSEQGYIAQLSIDCVIFGYRDRQLHVLVPKLNFNGEFWALPSGFVYNDEDVDAAATRILQDRTGLADVYLDQFRVFGKAARTNLSFLEKLIALNPDKLGEGINNRKEYEWITRRFVTIGYYALVDMNKLVPKQNELDQSIDWYPIKDLPVLILDHNEMIATALETLRENLDRKLIAFNLLPETFTMKEVQELYEAIFDRPFARNNFQKKILDLNVLERLDKKFTGAANKAPYLYRFLNR